MALSDERRRAYAALLERLGKRPRAVLERILSQGSVSTYDLGLLGYDQPPRAAQDLKEHGVPLRVRFGKHPKTGARMAIYSLDERADVAGLIGRRAFPSRFRAEVMAAHGARCNLCNAPYAPASLSLDHRIPYIVGGEPDALSVAEFQFLCGSHQRKKSWECEHCPNRATRDLAVCRTCFWAFPEGEFTHVATANVRRLDMTFTDHDLDVYEALKKASARAGRSASDHAKALLRKALV